MAGMRQEAAFDGFRLAYERTGAGPAVLLLHGWPGDRTDYRAVVPLGSQAADVVVPDLPGFGESPKPLDHLVSVSGPRGAFTASIAWYRAGAGSVAASLAEQVPDPGDRVAVPTTVLWPEHDPLFPREWSDRIGEFFADARLTWLDGAGHFSALEAPGEFT